MNARFVGLRSGLKVRVIEAGNPGNPPVVFVPGWGCGVWFFHYALPAFAEAGFRAIGVELKGHGLSDKPADPAEYTMESMRDHLLSILDALALPSTGLVGHSMGASLAAHVAAAAPDRISALALVAPVGFAGAMGMKVFRALTPAFVLPVLPHLAGPWLVKRMLGIAFGRITKPSERDIDEFCAPVQAPGSTTALRHLLHNYEWKAPFPRLAVPHMVMVAELDHLSPPKGAERYAGHRQPVVIEGASHALFIEAPREVNSALIDFFRAPQAFGYISPFP